MRDLRGQRLCVATHNRAKLHEIAALLMPFDVAVVSAAEMGLPEPVETEETFIGNARVKAHAAARESGLVALADDSGICIDALGGAPGVRSADWAAAAQGRDYVTAMSRVWAALEDCAAPEPRLALFRCALMLAWPDGDEAVFEGVTPGRIVWPVRGNLGHGYDPMFQPDGYALTFAEMEPWQKNRISHRADALAKLVASCFT